MGIPDHLTYLLRNLYAGQKATVRTGRGKLPGSKLGKEYVKAVYCHPAYLTYIQSTSCKMLGWIKHKLQSRLLGELSITSDMQMIPPLWQKAEEVKSLLMKLKEETKNVGLKLNIQKTKIMASSPITSCQVDGKTMETVTHFLFLGSKITADGNCSHEIKMLTPWKKSYGQPEQHIKKEKHHFAHKVLSIQSYSFSNSHV